MNKKFMIERLGGRLLKDDGGLKDLFFCNVLKHCCF